MQLLLELVFDVCLSILLAVFYGITYSFKTGTPKAGDVLGVAGFPRIVIVLALFLLLGQIISTVRKILAARKSASPAPEASPAPSAGEAEAPAEPAPQNGYARVLICIAIIAAYLLLMKWVGFTVSTFLFAFAFAKAVGYKSNGKLLIFSVLFTALLVVVFGLLFSIPLPRGTGFLKELSFYLY